MSVTPPWIIAVTAAVFGCAAYFATLLSAAVCKNIVPFEDGPRVGPPPVAAFIAGAALVGASLAWRGAEFPALALLAVIVVSLVACCYSDIRCGVIPDYFTLVPLAIVLVASGFSRSFMPLVSASIIAAPFALAAAASRGRGMGWGDVKLVALGAAVLGLDASILAFAAACLVAVAVAFARGRRTEPVAFAPYLAGAIAVGVSIPGIS